MSNVFGPKKPLFGPYTYRVKRNVNGDTLIAVYHGAKRIAHMDAYWAYSMRTIEEHEAEETQRAAGGRRRRLVCASDLRALGAEGKYPNVLGVAHAYIDDDAYKGKGVGRAMYEAMMVEGYAVRETRVGGSPGPMFFIPDECKGAGNTSAEAQRVWASLVRDYPSQGTSIRVDAPPVIGSRAKVNPRRLRNGTNPLAAVVAEAEEASRWFEPHAARWREEDRAGGSEEYIGLDDMGLVVPARQGALKQRFGSGLLGSGVFRTVVAASDRRFVIKLAMRPSDNLDEAAFWEHAGPKTREILVPVVAVDPKGRWLIMERVTPLPRQHENSPALRAACMRAKAVGLLDVHADNLSSDFRLLDYAEPVSSRAKPNPRRVSAAERTRILREVTESVKDEMQRVGWWTDDAQGNPVERFDRPSEWDINNGMCEEWAEAARRRLGGEAADLAALRYEKFGLPEGIFEDLAHVVLLLDGRFYDAQDPQGVSDPRKLHLIRRVSREAFIGSRAKPNPRRLNPVTGAFSHDAGEQGTGEEIAGTLNDEPVGSIIVFPSAAALNQTLLREEFARFRDLPRGKVGWLGGMELPESSRNKGHGAAIVSAMLDEARALGVRSVVLHADSTASRRFWSRMGFVERDTLPADVRRGLWMTPMVKVL